MIKADLESPFSPDGGAGSVEQNIIYGQRAMYDAIQNGYAPIASHLLYTQILDDSVPKQRQLGIDIGKLWALDAEATLVYMDYGITPGMQYGIDDATAKGREVHYILIGKNP